MKDIVVSKRYASALYGSLASFEEKNKMVEDFKRIKGSIENSSEMMKLIKSPIIKKSDKLKAIDAISNSLSLSKTVKDFLLLLVNKNRLSLFMSIYDALIQLYNEDMGVTEAEVVLAVEVKDSFLKEIEDTLSRVTGKRVTANPKINSAIIGGFVAKVKSSLYDASIKGQLDKLSEKMLEV